ncbi:hypothetical protein [Mediterraneibacter gnavus]|uniref:hypothetical protein n=1 Tax=Mediterraneibacter gnavus TaxID=33038 RepID=UPI00232F7922|nr:hypothetical protein [Mediterraneibacter gnavus]MDB8711787.1 hypothetical protein [Mediterraneibacter gnavus]MDB8714768.1 hypothetical protein [Mediterraneibacter gnavus]
MKVKVISIIVIIILLLGCGIGYYIYKDKTKQNEIAEQINEISKIEKTFFSSNERNDKLNLLKSILEEKEKYNSSSESYKEVLNKYDESISSMQSYFITEYDKIIEENTLNDLGAVEDIDTLTKLEENLNTLLTTIESEKEYTLSDDSKYQEYAKKISSLTEGYSKRITDIEEKKKAEEEAQKKAAEEAARQTEEKAQRIVEEQAKTHYENEYFSVDVPSDWSGMWTVTEEDNSLNGIASTVYTFSYNGDNTTQATSSGGAMVYVLDMSDTSRPLSHYSRMIPSECEEIGFTSSGYYDVFKTEAGAGFFDHGATITLK